MLCKTDRGNGQAVVMERRTNSGLFEIISHSDGGYRIAFNGEVLNVFCWKSNELADCMRTLDRLVGAPSRDRER